MNESLPEVPKLELIHRLEPARRVIDHAATGQLARDLRIASSLSLRSVARKIQVSAGQLSLLETGRAKWSELLVARYLHAIAE